MSKTLQTTQVVVSDFLKCDAYYENLTESQQICTGGLVYDALGVSFEPLLLYIKLRVIVHMIRRMYFFVSNF